MDLGVILNGDSASNACANGMRPSIFAPLMPLPPAGRHAFNTTHNRSAQCSPAMLPDNSPSWFRNSPRQSRRDGAGLISPARVQQQCEYQVGELPTGTIPLHQASGVGSDFYQPSRSLPYSKSESISHAVTWSATKGESATQQTAYPLHPSCLHTQPTYIHKIHPRGLQNGFHFVEDTPTAGTGSFRSPDFHRDSTRAYTPDNLSVTTEEPSAFGSDEDFPQTPDTPYLCSFTDLVEMDPPAKSKCSFDPGCELLSPDRKVTSHYFGRNKKETRAIPEGCWVLYCRQHYQRVRYRSSDADFAQIQMELVKATVENLEKWGGVDNFSLSLRKRAMDRIKNEDEHCIKIREAKERGLPVPAPIESKNRCRERWLLQYTGTNVSYQDVYRFIDIVINYCKRQQCHALEFELVPNFKEGYTKKHYPARRAAYNRKQGSGNKVTKPSKSSSNLRLHKSSRASSEIANNVRSRMLASRPKSE